MSATQRVTLSLPAELLEQARAASEGNLSKLVSDVLHEHFENERLKELHTALVAAYIAKAEEDLETAEAFRYAEDEAVALYVPPFVLNEAEKHLEPELVDQGQ